MRLFKNDLKLSYCLLFTKFSDISHRGDVFDVLMDHVALKDCVLPDAYLSKLAEATSQQPKSQTPMEVQGETLTHSDQLETPTRSSAATISDGGFSQLRMLAAESVGRMISGEPAAMVHELLQFFKPDYIAEGCTYQNQIHFYLFQTLKQVGPRKNFNRSAKLAFY